MTAFEQVVEAELARLVRTGVPVRGIRITVRELVVTRIERGPLGAWEVNDAVAAAVRAASRLARARSAPLDLVEVVCIAALEAVRGHGGDTAQWLEAATRTMAAELERFAQEDADEPGWRWLMRRAPSW